MLQPYPRFIVLYSLCFFTTKFQYNQLVQSFMLLRIKFPVWLIQYDWITALKYPVIKNNSNKHLSEQTDLLAKL